MPAQGNALGWWFTMKLKPQRGDTIPTSEIVPPLQGLSFCDDRDPGRRSRWSLALG